ncbi:MAG: MFS transporter, partial [Acidobacteriota bacterium]|nr:MFS transporter [Acidobacteriota bacterium]
MSERRQSFQALAMTTAAFAVCFACWVINSILVTALTSSGIVPFSESQVGWLIAAPALTGSLSRLPLGMLADRFGGRKVLFAVMLVTALPLYLMSYASTYSQFLMASLGFGLAGGSFPACVAYISACFEQNRQGTALGTLGIGNAGAAATTLLAPRLFGIFTSGGNPEGWRMLPRVYALALLAMTLLFWLTTRDRLATAGAAKTLRSRFDPLRDIRVWRFGLYYILLFGGFVALAQWIVPYTLNSFQLSLAQAGIIASVFSLPAGLIRAAGGWLADRFGALSVMYYVFAGGAAVCLLLSVPRVDLRSPGEGLMSKTTGVVTSVSSDAITVGTNRYKLAPPPVLDDRGTAGSFLPQITKWQLPAVSEGAKVSRKQLLATGVTRIFYPSSILLFTGLILILGVVMGLGSAAVYRLIPDQFPGSVGVVGGTVGLLGGLGGFLFPPLFGYLLHWTGLWSSCWAVL